jgi:hypothetical protein
MPYFHPTPCVLLCRHRAVLCPQWGPRNTAARAARYYSVLCRATLKMLACRCVSSSHVHLAHCTRAYVHGRARANARVVSHVSRACAAIYVFIAGDRMPARGWSPRVNVLRLRHMASQASSIHSSSPWR